MMRGVRSAHQCSRWPPARLHQHPRHLGSSRACASSHRTTGAATTAVEFLVLEVDGFAADRAAQRFPELAQLDQASVQASLSELQQLLPARILGSTLSNHPQLLAEDMAAWREFLDAFGFTQQQMQELLRSCPEAFHQSNVFQAGQLLLFLRQDLQLSDAEALKRFAWAAGLKGATQDSMRAVTAALQQAIADADSGSSSSGSGGGGGSVGAPPALQLLEAFPEVLGWDAARDLAPKLRFFAALGATGQRALQGSLWQPDTQWLPGLKSYHYSVAPKLQLLADTLGGNEAQAQQLVVQCPTVLKLPVESKLQPLLGALAALGLSGGQVAALLQACPQLLAESKDALVSRLNFLYDAIGGTADDLLAFPRFILLPLDAVIGPRFWFLGRHPGWVDAFSDAATGSLALRRVMDPSLEDFLADVAQATGTSSRQVAADYKAMATEWNELLGWCCEKAFCDVGEDSSLYEQEMQLFYMMMQ